MAEIRFNYGDKFTQPVNNNVGIGSTIPAAKLEYMMEEVQREWDMNPQVDRPPLDKMLEWLWTDIHNNSLNKSGAFYTCCKPHYINKTGA